MEVKGDEGKLYSEIKLEEAHKHTFANEFEVKKSTSCTCFYCGYRFEVSYIEDEDWWEENGPIEKTLACPKCGIDAVLGDASGYPIKDQDFIKACTENWFNGYSRISSELKGAID